MSKKTFGPDSAYFHKEAEVLNTMDVKDYSGKSWNGWIFGYNFNSNIESKIVLPDEDSFIKFASSLTLRNEPAYRLSYGTYFGLKYEGSPEVMVMYGACFGSLAAIPNHKNKIEKLYHRIFFNTKVERDQSIAYLDFIFDEKKSPWRSVLQYVKLHFNGQKSWENLVTIEVPNIGSVPIQPVMNFLWAVRMVYEHPAIIRDWNLFVAEGLTPLQALYATTIANAMGGSPTAQLNRRAAPGHCWFSNNNGNLSFKRLKEGDMVFSKDKNLAKDRNYEGAISVWNTNYDKYRYDDKWIYLGDNKFTIDYFFQGTEKYTGALGTLFARVHMKRDMNNLEFNPTVKNFGTAKQFVEKFKAREEFKDE